MAALLAGLASSSREAGVLYALYVYKELVLDLALLTAVDAVVRFVVWLGFLEVTADAAVVDELRARLIYNLLLGLQHVVALAAESHSSERHRSTSN